MVTSAAIATAFAVVAANLVPCAAVFKYWRPFNGIPLPINIVANDATFTQVANCC